MAKKTVKKVDAKKVTKMEASAKIEQFFSGLGMTIIDGKEFGFTEGTLVLKSDKCDVQIKLITPKAGVERYELLVDEDEEEEEIAEEETETETEE